MTAKLRILLVVCACVFCPAAARADDGGLLEWIEKMSGPGPFWGVGGYLRYYCIDKDAKGAWLCLRPEDGHRPKDERHIFAVSVAYFRTYKDRQRFFDTPAETGQIHFWAFEPRYFYRFHEALDAGVGFGIRRFAGESSGDFDPFTRWTVTPASIVFVPFAITSTQYDHPLRRLIKLHLEETYIGAISGADFKSASTYRTSGEFLSSFRVEIDPFVFLKGYRGFTKKQ